MTVDFPEFKRCCCCSPLRYGLIAGTYIKLFAATMFVMALTAALVNYCRILIYYGMIQIIMPQIVINSVVLILLLLDASFTIVFLIGGHKKSVHLMKVFYIYNIVLLCMMITSYVIAIMIGLYIVEEHFDESDTIIIKLGFWFKTITVIGLMIVGIEAYFVLLIRSELRKLSNNHNFRFTNNATEAECIMENGVAEKAEDIKEDTLIH